MDTFVRGAKVKPPVEKPITLNEASFVCCEIASKQGMTKPEFLVHMMRAWMALEAINAAGTYNG